MFTQCGVNQEQFSASSCSSLGCKLSLASSLRPYTSIPTHTCQVCLGASKAHCILTLDLSSLVTANQFPFLNSSEVCSVISDSPLTINIGFLIPRFLLSALVLILALIQTVKEAVGMYRATKRWQPNRYMKLLAKHGILYFLTYVDCFLLPICRPISHNTCKFSKSSSPCTFTDTFFSLPRLGVCISIPWKQSWAIAGFKGSALHTSLQTMLFLSSL